MSALTTLAAKSFDTGCRLCSTRHRQAAKEHLSTPALREIADHPTGRVALPSYNICTTAEEVVPRRKRLVCLVHKP
jgi:hypothetical protein